MKAKEKVEFSKFLPSSQQFIVIKGSASSPNDFSLNIDIGDGSDKASFYIDDHYFKDGVVMLRAMRDAFQKSLEFYEKAMKLPVETPEKSNVIWEDLFSKKVQKPAKKKATSKK